MTPDQRKILELTERLEQVIADRDQLQLQLNQMRSGFARIEREIGLALGQVGMLEPGRVAATNSDKRRSE